MGGDLAGDGGSEGIEDLERLLEGGFFLGLLRHLLGQFHNLRSQDVEDALVEAATNTVARLQKRPVNDVRKYLTKAAYTACKRAAMVATDLAEGTDAAEQDSRQQPSHDEHVLRELAVAIMRAEVRTWDNAHIREVTLTYMDMYLAGEVLEADEVAEIVSLNLGEEISVGSISQWKARGFRRLREFMQSNEWYERRTDLTAEEVV